jgi:hypothetical protein
MSGISNWNNRWSFRRRRYSICLYNNKIPIITSCLQLTSTLNWHNYCYQLGPKLLFPSHKLSVEIELRRNIFCTGVLENWEQAFVNNNSFQRFCLSFSCRLRPACSRSLLYSLHKTFETFYNTVCSFNFWHFFNSIDLAAYHVPIW